MGRRHFTGKLSQHRRTAPVPQPSVGRRTSMMTVNKLGTMLAAWWQAAYSCLNINYLAIITVVLMVILSFALPDISHKIQRTHEIKTMKKVLEFMTNEVTKAETSCLTVAKDICYIQCSMHDTATETINEQHDLSVCTSKCLRRTQSEPVLLEAKVGFLRRFFCLQKNTSNKEIAIMSYLYTDSFDAKKN